MNAQLKDWLRKRILLVIKKLRKLEKKIIGFSDADPNYSSLSPIGNSAESEKYSEALDWALKNRSVKDIKNIALTGPYGSGKSTILKTYYNNYSGKDLKFLFISLATFKEENQERPEDSSTPPENSNPIVSEKNQLLRLIETSILQQIFYHENDNKIPDSRFKKIRSFGFWQLLGYSVVYSLFLISLYVYLKPGFINSIFKDWKITQTDLDWIHYSSVAVITFGLFSIIFSSIRVIRSVTLQKLNFQNAEIGIGVNQNKSILNHHIDEILYFFSVRPYNVVVIEDLDRFKQTEIFTKLREINLLLNNSNKTKRKDIVFIYAVRDDMFTDKERTKFFDFIIPAIPIINSSNSAKILMAKRKEFNYKLSDDLIEDVAYYIDDMRLLHNITNEFYLYKELLDPNLTQDKLFAIITYKNIQPQQFGLLNANSGKIYDLIYSKRLEIETRTATLNEHISDLISEIKRLDDLFISNMEEIRLLYLAKLLPKLKNIKSFFFESTIISIEDMTNEENFAHLENDELKYQFYYTNTSSYREETSTKAIDIKFKDLQELVNPGKSYKERLEEIDALKSNKIKTLRSKIQELDKEKEQLRNLPIANIMQQNAVKTEPGQELALEDILTRNGYIAEDYLDYISLFHDGDISRTDYQFLLNLKNGKALDMDYKLQKTERVISKISPLTFQTHFILNFDLFDEILKNPSIHADRLGRMLDVLKSESNTSVKFITAYLGRTPYLQLFLRRLSKSWPNIWFFFETLPEMEDTMKKQLFNWLIAYLENSEVLALSKHYDLTKKIATDPLFPQVIADQNKMRDLLTIMDIKFQELDMTGTTPETLQYIFKNEHYQLSPVMLGAMMKKFGKYDQHTFEQKNYSAIKNSESNELISYVHKNIDTYVESVYLRLEHNTRDEEVIVLLLLNNAYLKSELKTKIVDRMDKKVTALVKVNDKEVIAELFKRDKLLPTWENLLHDFLNHKEEISEEVISFLNSGENAEIISKIRIPSQGERRADYSALAKKLALVTTFHDDAFKKIAGANSFWFSDLDLSAHSYKQVEVLVEQRVIHPVKKTFDYLKEEFNGLHIRLFEREQEEMMKILNTLTLDSEDLEGLLKSDKILYTNLSKILAETDESLVSSNPKSLQQLVGWLNAHRDFTISATLLDAALLSSKILSVDRIKVLMTKKVADNAFLESFISTLDGNYAKISDLSKRPTFAVTELNRSFLQLLKSKGMISSFPEHKGEYKVYHKAK
jgi:hypothetical protein